MRRAPRCSADSWKPRRRGRWSSTPARSRGSVDTTISQGLTFRVGERDKTLAGKTNSNDGNLNYDRGIVANTSKFTTDLDIQAGRFGAFVRAAGFVDYENRDGKRERTELSDDAKERVGGDIGVLDAYVTAPFEAGDAAIDLRLGKHVLNWGESTFIPNGINAINPFDVSKLRLPGSELREALLPVWMASVDVAATDTLSVAGFYQLVWEETHIDPVGSYFSTTDYAGPGARKAVVSELTAGRDDGHGFGPLAALIDADLAALGRANPAAVALGATTPISSDRDFAGVLRGPDARAPGLRTVGRDDALPRRGSEPDRVRLLLHQLSQQAAHGRRADRQREQHSGGACGGGRCYRDES